MEGGDVCVTPFCVRPEYLCLRKLQKSCLLLRCIANYINFDLCILLLVTIIGLFMNDPYSLVSRTSHKK